MSQLFFSLLGRQPRLVGAPPPEMPPPPRPVPAPVAAPIRWRRSSKPWTGPGMAVYQDTTEASAVMFPDHGPGPDRIIVGSGRG